MHVDDVAAVKDKILDKLQQPPKSSDQSNVTGAGGSNGSPYTHNTNGLLASSASGSNRQLLPVSGSASAATSSKTAYDGEGGDSSSNLLSGVSNLDSPHGKSSSDMPGGNGSLLTGKAIGEAKHYWQHVDSATRNAEDTVIIHVCDENQNISRDFCCKRRILVKHMKYFEKFLAENENGYDDIDISVHCDVEIFEWLMTYIHAPDAPPTIDKSILVSILISSEFLQMESLVELCVQQVASNLNDIIKLPIDLSCISERLINRIAALTHPKVCNCRTSCF